MTIEHNRRIQFEYGVVDGLSPLVRRVICNNPGPFTFTGTGTYLIGTGNVAVIDPGPAQPEHVEAILSALSTGEAISHIVITHTHADHSTAAQELAKRTGAKVYASPLAASVVGTPETSTSSLTEAGTDHLFIPDEIVNDEESIYGDDWTLTAIATPGHTREHLCYELPEERVMFTGDHIMAWATSVVVAPGGSMLDYIASLDRVANRKSIDRLWPTHGPAVDQPRAYVHSLITHRRNREDQIRELLHQGIGTISDMVPILYAEYDRNVWFAAAATVHAHLIAMIDTGEVEVGSGAPLSFNADFRLIRT